MKINEQIKNKYPWGAGREWKSRTQMIVEIMPTGVTVLDLGGGFCNLKKYLKYWQTYISIDVEKWTDLTIKADFNKGEFPDDMGQWQIIVCQGLLEYIENPEQFLTTIKKYGDTLIITYLMAVKCDVEQRKNRLTFKQVKDILAKVGWKIVFEKDVSEKQKLFYCKNNDARTGY